MLFNYESFISYKWAHALNYSHFVQTTILNCRKYNYIRLRIIRLLKTGKDTNYWRVYKETAELVSCPSRVFVDSRPCYECGEKGTVCDKRLKYIAIKRDGRERNLRVDAFRQPDMTGLKARRKPLSVSWSAAICCVERCSFRAAKHFCCLFFQCLIIFFIWFNKSSKQYVLLSFRNDEIKAFRVVQVENRSNRV